MSFTTIQGANASDITSFIGSAGVDTVNLSTLTRRSGSAAKQLVTSSALKVRPAPSAATPCEVAKGRTGSR